MSALSDLLTLAAIGLAYWMGRQHEFRKDQENWRAYGKWLAERRRALKGRFLRSDSEDGYHLDIHA